MAAMMEVIQGMSLLFALLLPSRDMLFTMMWWQFLRIRYMSDASGNVKRSFSVVDQQILSLVGHQYVNILYSLYL